MIFVQILLLFVAASAANAANAKKIAVIGEGVIGLNTATAILNLARKTGLPKPKIDVYHHKDFSQILSRNIAGLFRIDVGTPINIKYGKDTFEQLATYWRAHGGLSGVQLVSGHILSDAKSLEAQRKSYADIVYNYRDLADIELFGSSSLFNLPRNESAQGIHYTAYTSEGLLFCPFLKNELIENGVTFIKRRIQHLDELGKDYDVVVNAAGLAGGIIAGDDVGNVFPIRGVLLKVKAPWQKHFLYRDFRTFTIPVIDSVYVGTVKQDMRVTPLTASKEDLVDIVQRYLKLQPSFRSVNIESSFVGHRPGRQQIRVEKQQKSVNGKTYTVVHNYGHGGNGFTLAYGTGLHAAHLALDLPLNEYQSITPKPLSANATMSPWVAEIDL